MIVFSVFCQVTRNYGAVRTFFPTHLSFGNVFALPCLCLALPLGKSSFPILVHKGVFGKVNNKSTLYRAGEKLYKYCTMKTQKYHIYLIKTTLCSASIKTIPTYQLVKETLSYPGRTLIIMEEMLVRKLKTP